MAAEESPLPTSTRRLFGAGNMLVLLVISATLISLFALQLDIAVPWHSAWSSKANNDTHAVTSPMIDVSDPETKYRLANEAIKVPTIESLKGVKDNYKWYTDAKLRWLAACMARGDCPANADKVVIFSTFHCQWALWEDYHGGEGIWCLGMIDALEAQGFTVLHGGPNDWYYMEHIYRQIPDLVRVIISEDGDGSHGHPLDVAKTKDRPQGIPLWKFFATSYYPAGWTTLVGHAWVVTAEPNPGDEWGVSINPATSNAWIRTGEEDLHVFSSPDRFRFTYLGYPVHPQPSEANVIPWDERPNQVWIMGKYAHYFHNGDQRVYDMDFWQRAHDELSKEFPGFQFVGAIEDKRSDEDKEKWGPIPSVVHNFGTLNRTEFTKAFGNSRLMMGMGAPTLSPSPYQALAMAVPFANPHKLRDDGKNSDDHTWSFVQHESLERVPEPYVYQVQAFNYTSFVNTIRTALRTPIGQCRFERMKDEVVQRRLAAFVTHDWYSEAKKLLDRRLNGTFESDTVGLFEL